MCPQSPNASNEFDTRVDRFDTMWHGGTVPEIEDFLPVQDSAEFDDQARRNLLAELVMIDLEFRWRRTAAESTATSQEPPDRDGPPHDTLPQRPRLEDYLRRYPQLGPLDKLSTELIGEEYRARQRWGDQPNHDDYRRRFPWHDRELQDVLRQIDTEIETSHSIGLSVRCPHCNDAINLVSDPTVTDVCCPSCGSSFSLLPQDQESDDGTNPLRVGHFELMEKIGSGTFGTVWKARDRELDRIVAVKIPRRDQLDDTQAEQFLREARVIAQLNHPNIVGVHEIGREGATVFIVTDLVVGESLSDWLNTRRSSFSETAILCAKTADALHHAHQTGVVHRDLKPENIIVDRLGEPKLTDFGLARRQTGEVTMTADGQILGTPAYMSPEQAEGRSHQADSRSDIYSLGVILFRMLTGEMPFRGSVHMLMHQIVHDDAPQPRRLNARVPPDLETICLKCLQKDPGKRYGSARELAEELQRFLRGEAIQTRPIGPLARGWRWCKRYPAVSSLAIGLLLVLLAGLAGVASQWILADQQRDTANRHLYQALIGQARALRTARVSGYRREVFGVVKQALAIDTPAKNIDELRQAAVACMGDFVGFEPTVWDNSQAEVRQIAARPLTTQLAIGLEDGTLLLRDLADGSELASLPGNSSRIRALAFDTGGKILASADDDGNVLLWRADANDKWSCTKTFSVPELGDGIDTLAIDPDGEHLFVSHDRASKITTHGITEELDDPVVIELPLANGTASRRGRAFSPDCTLLASGREWQGVHLLVVWNIAKRQIVRSLETGLGHINAVSFSNDGHLVACACADGAVVFDNAEDWDRTRLPGDVTPSVAFGPNNKLLAIASWQLDLIRLWSIPENREVAVLSNADVTTRTPVVFTEDGKRVAASGSRSVHIWNLAGATEKLITRGHTGGVPGLAFSPDGKRLASAGKDYTVRLWDPNTGNPIHTIDLDGQAHSVAFSPDGRMLATGDWSGAVEVWDAQSAQRMADIDHHVGPIQSIAFSPNGEYFAASGDEGATVWPVQFEPRNEDVGSRLALGTPVPLTTEQNVDTLVFSPDSKLLAWAEGRQTGTGHVWDLEIAQELLAPPLEICAGHHCMAFHPNSKLLTFVSRDKAAELWDVTTRQRTLRYASQEHLSTDGVRLLDPIALSNDGRWAARKVKTDLGQALTIWDPDSQELLLKFPEEPGAIWAFAWSPDRNLLAAGTSTGGPVIWNIPKIREQLAELGLDW